MGRSRYANDTTYTGEYLNNQKHGFGKLENVYKGISYDGSWYLLICVYYF